MADYSINFQDTVKFCFLVGLSACRFFDYQLPFHHHLLSDTDKRDSIIEKII